MVFDPLRLCPVCERRWLEHLNHAMPRQGYTAIASGERVLRPSAHTETPAIYSPYKWTGDTVLPAIEPEPATLRYVTPSARLSKKVETWVDHAMRHSPQLIVRVSWASDAQAAGGHESHSCEIGSNYRFTANPPRTHSGRRHSFHLANSKACPSPFS